MSSVHTIPVKGFDSKRSLALYECVAEDHLACQEWLDRHLRGDYLFKKQHLQSIITRPTSVMFAILLDGLYVGTAIVYAGSVLHNIMIAEEYRGLGIGEAVIRHLAPSVIRAKTNMIAGDPVPFYAKLGYQPTAIDPERPHIVVMEPASAGHASVSGDAGAPRPVTVPAPVVSEVVTLPEASCDASDAEKWRSLKARQRARHDRKKESKKAIETVYASRYAPPPGVAVNAQANRLDYNSFGE